jgi:hypothetical protein
MKKRNSKPLDVEIPLQALIELENFAFDLASSFKKKRGMVISSVKGRKKLLDALEIANKALSQSVKTQFKAFVGSISHVPFEGNEELWEKVGTLEFTLGDYLNETTE